MQILVTGGNGYLGGRIVEHLTQMGLSIRVGGRDIFSDSDSLESACSDITAVVHLAAMNAQDCDKDPEAALMVNVLNSLRLLNSAERMGASKFIYFSTAHVYGSPLFGELREDSLPRALHPYSITHRTVEDYVLEANNRGKLSGIVFRLTNAVGAPVREDANCWMLVVNDLCQQVVVDQKMVLHSDESIERDYIPISSVTAAVSFFIDNLELGGDIYNLSSGYAYSLRALTDIIADRSVEVLGFRPTVKFNLNLNDNISQNRWKDKKKLKIANDRLKSTGFVIESDLVAEIDQLLINCQNWFTDSKLC
jgi:UDP-glucose 4-epimerase